jgi:hypothetical protein
VAAHDYPPPDCAATVVGRRMWRERGALTLRRTGSGFTIDSARPANFDRPWEPPPRRVRTDNETSGDDATTTPSRAPPRDATPQQDDIEADQ